MLQFLPTHFCTEGTWRHTFDSFPDINYDRILLLFSQKRMLMLRWMHRIHLLSFPLERSFFFALCS